MKILHFSIIIVIVSLGSVLGYMGAKYWNEHKNGTPIASPPADLYQTYVTRFNVSPGEYISFEYLDPPMGSQLIRIANPSNGIFNECNVYEEIGTSKIIIKRFQIIEQNFESFTNLNGSSKDEITKLHFSCKNPGFDISWPDFTLDKKDYQHGDTLTFSGNLLPSSEIQVLVFEPVGASYLIHDLSTNPFISQQITTDSAGNFSFSYDIPIDQANGKWIIGIKSGYNEYYFMFRVNMQPGTF